MKRDSLLKLGRSEFLEQFGELFRAIFECHRTCTFATPGWPKAFVPYGLNLDSETFQAVRLAATQAGESEWIGTTTETLPAHDCSIVAPWRESVFRGAVSSTVLGHFDGCLFGSSGRWGLLLFNSEDFGVFAAEPTVFSTFCGAAGGRSAIASRFREFMQTEWVGSDERRKALLRQSELG